jgi:hypothetical protein
VWHALLAVKHEAAALRVELPDAFRVGGDVQDVAGVPAGHLNLRFAIADLRLKHAADSWRVNRKS